jgi:DMSO/TMAO reductase YedYZ molybdopterin-dependent catalytic subunit
MKHQDVSRRALLKGGGATLASYSVLQITNHHAHALGGPAVGQHNAEIPFHDETAYVRAEPPQLGDEVVPWDDQAEPIPPPAEDEVGHPLVWEELNSTLTPNEQFFTVKHYEQPDIDATDWRLDIDGLVATPTSLTLDDLRAQPRKEVEFTLECSGNTFAPFFIGGIGNALWAGAALAPLLTSAGPLEQATEVVFWGADSGTVTIRDNSGVTGAGDTGTGEPDDAGVLDLTITEQFARSMSLEDAMQPDHLLAYEMNSEPLPGEHGFPVRLIAPGWYGVANVKWLTRVELVDRRFAGRFMTRDYVSIREDPEGSGEGRWTFATVGPARLKSAPAKVTRRDGLYTVIGVAWGAPIETAEISIDAGPWQPVELVESAGSTGHAWRLWTFDWATPESGEHSIASRVTDVTGAVQPPPDDPFLASRRTYWENNGQITRYVTIP